MQDLHPRAVSRGSARDLEEGAVDFGFVILLWRSALSTSRLALFGVSTV